MAANRKKIAMHHLEIVVGSGCSTCKTAFELADEVARWEIENLTVAVVHLGRPGVTRPRAVFAVPTYLLDGAIISLGNPSAADLRARLERITGVT